MFSSRQFFMAAVALLAMTGPAAAGTILCDQDAPNGKNYMALADSHASACLAAGVGTLSGNPSGGNPDEFLTSGAGAGYATVSKTGGTNPFNLAYDATTKTWSFDASAWDVFGSTMLAIGFKWGTGNTPDEYFVFQLVPEVTSGIYEWFNIAMQRGDGGLSHMILYAKEGASTSSSGSSGDVAESGSLTILGLGLLGMGFVRRRQRR